MNRYNLIAEVLTNMAKDDSIDIEIALICMQLGETNDEMLNLMLKWNKSTSEHDKKATLIAINSLIEDYKTFGNEMYGKT